MPAYFWTAWVTLAALLVYFWITFNVGRARGKFGIDAPVMDGPLPFLSVLRVHANTVEQIVMFLPALWLCAVYRGDYFAAAGGAVWIVGRIVFALAYYRDPAKRGPGFVMTILATLGLMIAAASGLLQR
ncbi:MAG: MAPEG family protein [Pseudomonadota bacterium]